MEQDDGVWTIIQRRRKQDNISFHRSWISYKKGFGNLENSFWLGNDYIHEITKQTSELKISTSMGQTRYANFFIQSENKSYKIFLGNCSGKDDNIGKINGGALFSTRDKDNANSNRNCARLQLAGWWYKDCVELTNNINSIKLTESLTNTEISIRQGKLFGGHPCCLLSRWNIMLEMK